jgi:3D (Asp-Asp-Asp) domain-containing protein
VRDACADVWRNGMNRPRRQLAVLLGALGATVCLPAAADAYGLTARSGAIDRPAARAAAGDGVAHASRLRTITKPTWVSPVTVTEYFPIPEAYFRGARVRAPGLTGRHRIDWLYSARGLTMEGDGIGLDGRRYHVDATGSGGWVDKYGHRATPGGSRPVFWRAGGFYRNARGLLTFPLDAGGGSLNLGGGSLDVGGGWFNGVGLKYVPLRGVSFATGPSLPLTYYRSIATDPNYIPRGSRVYIPYYRNINGGWFRAEDTGGAIDGKHVDVYRPPPPSIDDGGRYLTRQRIYVVPPRVVNG